MDVVKASLSQSNLKTKCERTLSKNSTTERSQICFCSEILAKAVFLVLDRKTNKSPDIALMAAAGNSELVPTESSLTTLKKITLKELIETCPDDRVSTDDVLKEALSEIFLADMEFNWFMPGPLDAGDILDLLLPHLRWKGKLF